MRSKARLGVADPRRRRVLARLIVAGWLACLSLARAEPPSPPSPPLSQWAHRAWRTQDGAPPEIVAIAQTTDGYLWLGTGVGLFRFDGIRFEEFRDADGNPLPSLNVSALLATPDGDLLVGYRFGGVSRLHGHHATYFGAADGVPAAAVYAFAEQADGVIWAATLGGLIRFDPAGWEHVDQRWGYTGDRAYEVLIDSSGTVWADDGRELMRLRRGEHRFEAVGERLDRAVIREAPDGGLWILDTPHRLRRRSAAGPTRSIRDWSTFASPNAMLVDRDGDVWVAGYDGGINRLRADAATNDSPAIERYAKAQGLASDFTLSILQDREGTFWVGSKVGLDQFRRQSFVALPLPSTSNDLSVVAGDDGEIWIGSHNGPMLRASGSGVHRSSDVTGATDGLLTCAMRAPDGTVWFGGVGKLLHRTHGAFAQIDVPTDISGDDVQAMVMAADGAMWISVTRAGLFRMLDGRWQRDGGITGFPGLNPLVATRDANDRLWFGYADNRIAMLDHERLQVFDGRAGIDIGNVTAVAAQGARLWFGGEQGLGLFEDGRFFPIRSRDPEALTAVSAIVRTPDGDLWVAARRGVYRIAGPDVDAVLADPRHVVATELFDWTDGLPGVPLQHRPLPASVLGRDGRLWVVTPDGLAWIDPRHLYRNAIAPPVAVETLSAGTGTWSAGETIRLAAGTRELSVRYTALSLARPERVQFRYRLVGSNDAWSETNARREAFFTNLGPGRYRFEVVASNDSGVWNLDGQALVFEIAPFFWQTTWFRFVCLVAGLAVLYALYVLRLSQISRRIQQRLQERFRERERIARELHDTLFQSVQGMIMQVHKLTLQGASVPRRSIDHALDQAEQVLVETRNRVIGLRDGSRRSGDLSAALTTCVDQISEGWSVPCVVDIEGVPTDVQSEVLEDLVGIAKEALFNAFRHASAKSIAVGLTFRRRDLRLTVTDDGCGIPPQTMADGGMAGHFGLPGMRERAQRLSTKLVVRRHEPRGTTIELVVSGRVAYARRAPWPRRAWSWGRRRVRRITR